jgi:hypothetical protein
MIASKELAWVTGQSTTIQPISFNDMVIVKRLHTNPDEDWNPFCVAIILNKVGCGLFAASNKY